MTPDQIIEEVWKLPWYQAIEVAYRDDFIVICKAWPLWLTILISAIILIWWNKNDNKKSFR